VSGGKNTGLEVERNAPAIECALDKAGKRYRKVAKVRARRALRKTTVNTLLADGTRETSNVAEPGDYIVTAASGERYVVKQETFEARYLLKPGRKTVYVARGQVIAVENPFRRPVSIMASWGERQHGAADCMIADVFDSASGRRAGEPYIIGRAEFEQTYRPVQGRRRKAPAPKRKLTDR
jgi:hypothetical protein